MTQDLLRTVLYPELQVSTTELCSQTQTEELVVLLSSMSLLAAYVYVGIEDRAGGNKSSLGSIFPEIMV